MWQQLKFRRCRALNVWSPHSVLRINSLERVHRHFTKRFIELEELSHQELLTVLNSETFEYRRLSYCDLTMYYKVFQNLTPWTPCDYFNIVIPPYNLHYV